MNRHLSLFVMALLLALPLTAQTVPTPETTVPASNLAAQKLSGSEKEKKGLAVLRKALAQSSEYSAPANLIFVESLGASQLWPHDETEARRLLADVRGRLSELATQPVTEEGQFRTLETIFRVSRQMAVEIAAYDPAAALEFLHATELKGLGLENDNLEISVAAVAARRHPKEAERLTAQNMETGDVMALAGSIQQIAAKDPVGATSLANQLVDRIIANLATDEGRQRAMEFLQWSAGATLSDEDAGEGAEAANSRSAFGADVLRPLALAMLNAARTPDADGVIERLQSILPVLQKLAPADAAAFARQHPLPATNQNDTGGLTVVHRVGADSTAVEQSTGGDSSPAADFLLSNNVTLDEIQRLIARAHVSQPEQQRALEQAVRAGREKLRQKRSPGNTQPPSGSFTSTQVNFYVEWSKSLLARGDKKNAIALLEDARALLPAEPESARQMGMLSQIATAYCDLDAARAAEIVRLLVRRFNAVLPTLLAFGDFVLRDEMPVTDRGELLLSSPFGFGLGEAMGPLTRIAEKDPDAALGLADELQRPEVRTLAYLQIARILLGKKGWISPPRAFMNEDFVFD